MNKITKFLANLLPKNQLFHYLAKNHNEITKAELENKLVSLPLFLEKQIRTLIASLPHHPYYQEAIESFTSKNFEQWRSHPETSNNAIAILTSAIIPVSQLISDSLAQWLQKTSFASYILPWNSRPTQGELIASELQFIFHQELADNTQSKSLKIIVIPDLSWCFLRTLEGLDGIDYLQNLLYNNRDCFWIIGMSKVCWDYLDSVVNFPTFFHDVLDLPSLNGEQLQSWFQPVLTDLELSFTGSIFDNNLRGEDENLANKYFQKLANVSEGISILALDLFLNSLKLEKESTPQNLIVENPFLPRLPDLNSDEHYLLYSLLLHNNLSIISLADSLGDELNKVQCLVQNLVKKNLIKRINDYLCINNIYYLQIKENLNINNFNIE